ncbi:hypothetical protein SCP_0804290 [Sparassis crispa]|uniref:Uncharacterized protein n=1 Tax=Sparassis crispa TaxID=139825 RepID=A0A401GUJ7_9APHY|nr:hypothetical protein SCP_0804290 [Sparassis crispa]GBE85905.1 hypothetical protein SCP_0804290 [Sparassis crispa]
MVHIAGAKTARAMWEQLRTVKEQRGQHGILELCRHFYWMQAKEEDNTPCHITQLRQIQEQFHLMGKVVSDKDFRLILATSLPESWVLSSALTLAPKALTTHERGERGQSLDQAMVAKGKKRPFGK